MKVSIAGIFVVALSGFLSAPVELAADDGGPEDAPAPATDAEASSEADSNRSARADKVLLRDIEAALTHLSAGGVLGNVSADQRRAVVEAVLEELGAAPHPSAEARAADSDDDSSARPPAERILALRDWCLYLRIFRMDAETAETVAEELRKDERASARWTLLDLRRVQGDEAEIVERMADALASRKAPLVALVGAGTRKGGERLIKQLRSERSVVTIGDPTPVYAYDSRQLSLPSGIEVTVPDFSDDSGSAGRLVLKPDITVSYSGRGLDPAVFEQGDEDLRQALLRDPPIRRALDTLTAARAFAEPHF